MKVVLYTPFVTPHVIPWAREFARLIGEENFCYLYTHSIDGSAWKANQTDSWLLDANVSVERTQHLLESSDVLITGFRCVELLEHRARQGLLSVYSAERWYKPILLENIGWWHVALPGWVKLFHPGYLRMSLRLVRLFKTSPTTFAFPIGVHAARDIARSMALLDWRLWRFFAPLSLVMEKRSGGSIAGPSWCHTEKLRLFGYYVRASDFQGQKKSEDEVLRIMFVGRLISWKRIDILIKAVKSLCQRGRRCRLDIFGKGQCESYLRSLARGCPFVCFKGTVPNNQVREEMHKYDLYVMTSNTFEGWGATLSEAMAEEMAVIGTHEAGSSATMLPDALLYHANDVEALTTLLEGHVKKADFSLWSSKTAAQAIYDFISFVDCK